MLFPITPRHLEKELVHDLDKLHKKNRKERLRHTDERRSPYAIDLNDNAMMIIPGRGSVFGKYSSRQAIPIAPPPPPVKTVPPSKISSPLKSTSLPSAESVNESAPKTPAEPIQRDEQEKELSKLIDDVAQIDAELLRLNSSIPVSPPKAVESRLRTAELAKKKVDLDQSIIKLSTALGVRSPRGSREKSSAQKQQDMEQSIKKLDVVKSLQNEIELKEAKIKSLLEGIPKTDKEQQGIEDKVKKLEAEIEKTKLEFEKKEKEINAKEIRYNAVQSEMSSKFTDKLNYYYYNLDTGETLDLGPNARKGGNMLKEKKKDLKFNVYDIEAGDINYWKRSDSIPHDFIIFKPSGVDDLKLRGKIEASLKKRKKI